MATCMQAAKGTKLKPKNKKSQRGVVASTTRGHIARHSQARHELLSSPPSPRTALCLAIELSCPRGGGGGGGGGKHIVDHIQNAHPFLSRYSSTKASRAPFFWAFVKPVCCRPT